MTDFVSTIRRITHEKYEKYDRVAKGRERPPVHQPPNLFPVPAEYTNFVFNAPAPAPRRRGKMICMSSARDDGSPVVLIF